ncbi:MAG: HIT family protein [Desulfitobacteriaceae bacterium]
MKMRYSPIVEILREYGVPAEIQFQSPMNPFAAVKVAGQQINGMWIGSEDSMKQPSWFGHVLLKLFVQDVRSSKDETFEWNQALNKLAGKVTAVTEHGYLLDVGFQLLVQINGELESGFAKELAAGTWIEGTFGAPVFVYPLEPQTEIERQDEWRSYIDGETCPMCVKPGKKLLIAELSVSKLYLNPNQRWLGYSYVVFKDHVTDLHLLSEADSNAYYQDMMRAANAIVKAFHPDKMNFDNLGNVVPHLHWHIIPRYAGDGNWRNPPWSDWYEWNAKWSTLTEAQYTTIIEAIRTNLK